MSKLLHIHELASFIVKKLLHLSVAIGKVLIGEIHQHNTSFFFLIIFKFLEYGSIESYN